MLGLALLAGIGAVAARPAEPVDAAWSDAEAARSTVSAGTLAAPSPLGCETTGGLLGLGSSVRLSWPSSTVVERYQLFGRVVGGATWTPAGEPITGNEVTLGVGLLGGLVQGLVDTLLGGSTGRVELSVRALVGDSWVSPPSNAVTVRKSRNLLLVVSYACEP